MRIDIHAHYTLAPPQLDAFRGRQVGEQNKPRRLDLNISDEEVRASVLPNIAAMDDRGIDVALISPRASGMGHDFGDVAVSRFWTETNNDLIARVCDAYPTRFAGVCQLPQSPLSPPAEWLSELERCVADLGFVGCLINPDISGGLQPFTPSLGSEYWYPLWERLVALDVPGMIHASSTRNPAFHTNGAHYIAWDYTAVVELASSSVFEHFPDLRLVIPHGGGGIPFQFNRHRALHMGEGLEPFENAIRRLHFDTSVYDADSLVMLVDKVGSDNVLFGAEMFGTARGIDPLTGRGFDDVPALLDQCASLTAEDREKIDSANALRVFPRLRSSLERRGILHAV